MSAEARLAEKLNELGIPMPPAPEPKGVYRPLVVRGDLIYTSGHLPVQPSGQLVVGRLVAELDVPAGYAAARLAGLGILASLRKELGTLDHVRRVLKVLGAVNCTPKFTQQPAVLNGCSELFAHVFGPQAGVGAAHRHRRGRPALGVPVEIEAIFEIA